MADELSIRMLHYLDFSALYAKLLVKSNWSSLSERAELRGMPATNGGQRDGRRPDLRGRGEQ